MAGEKRTLVDPAEKPGDSRCMHLIKVKKRTEFLDRDPLFRRPALLHVFFKKLGNIPVSCHFLVRINLVWVFQDETDQNRGISFLTGGTPGFAGRLPTPYLVWRSPCERGDTGTFSGLMAFSHLPALSLPQ